MGAGPREPAGSRAPAKRRRLVGELEERYGISPRCACMVVPISGKALWYQWQRPDRDGNGAASERCMAIRRDRSRESGDPALEHS